MKKSFTFTALILFCYLLVAQTVYTEKTTFSDDALIIPSAIELKKPFVVKNIEHYPDNEFFVFDKQGNLVFHAEYYDNTWDGKMEDGKEVVENEMCYYILDDGKGTVHTGYLQVIK
jgi:hypothetical protein